MTATGLTPVGRGSPCPRPRTPPVRREPRIGVLVVAYNAASTLASTLDRIPEDFRPRISEVFVCDDASPDRTHLVGIGYQETQRDLPISVIRHEKNLGYGGNQKAGYQLAAEHDLDIIVMLHADGQYAPEFLPGDGRAARHAARPTRSSAPG